MEMAKELLQKINYRDTSPRHVQIPDVLKLQARVMRDTHVQGNWGLQNKFDRTQNIEATTKQDIILIIKT